MSRPSSSEALGAMAAAEQEIVRAWRVRHVDPARGDVELRAAWAVQVRAELLLLASSGDREALRLLVDQARGAA